MNPQGKDWVIAGVAALLVAFATAPAMAAQTVELRPDISLHDGGATLGDLFADAGAAAPVVVASGAAPGANLVLDASEVQALAQAHGLIWNNNRGLRRLILRAGSAGATGRTGQSAVLVYARDLAPGEIVQPADVVWSRSPEYGAAGDAPRDSDAVIGEAARRALRAGASVSMRDVAAAQVIKANDAVSVAYSVGGIKLVLQGKAVTAGAIGEQVSVLNLASKKVILAVVNGPGSAVVGPEADRLSAAVRANPQLFASLH